jgi:hypothetical protein
MGWHVHPQCFQLQMKLVVEAFQLAHSSPAQFTRLNCMARVALLI